MTPPKPDTGRFRVIQGGRSVAKGNRDSFGPDKMPLEDALESPLLAVRRNHRLHLAERYHMHNTPRRRGWAPHPESEEKRMIGDISRNPVALKQFIEENEIDFKKEVAKYAHTISDADDLDDKSDAFRKLAMIASDPQMCGKKVSIAGLKILVMESIMHNTKEAKDALESLGFALEKIPRAEIVALATPSWIRFFSRRLKKAMRYIEWKLGSEGGLEDEM